MRPGRIIIGLVLILFGALFLAASLDWIEWSFFLSVWQLWPIVLILIGIQLLFGRRNPTLAALLMIVVLAAGVGLAIYAWETDGWTGWGDLETVAIEGPPAAGITSATAAIDIGAAEVTIDGARGPRIVTGTYEARGEPSIKQNAPQGPGSFKIAINQEDTDGAWFVPFTPRSENLELELAGDVPWTIDVNTGATDLTMDLEQVILQRLDLDAGASSVDITVGPDVADGATILIEGGAGSYKLRFPESLDVTVTTDTGLSSVNVDDRFDETGDDTWQYDGGGAQITLEVRAGVSSIEVELY